MKRIQTLLVDDDSMVLQLVSRVLAKSGNFDCVTAVSGEEALEKMEKQTFDVVVSDMNMPFMDGAELLQRVHDLYPETVRLVFSGATDTDMVLKTVGTTHQFLSKPEDLKLIESTVRRALYLQEMLPNAELRRTVSAIENLPSLPSVYMEVERELSKPDSSLKQIGALIEEDVGMSAKVLQLVNSAFFGLREHVSSPHQAASLLGTNILKSLVLMVHVFSEWEGTNGSGLSLADLWSHSMGVATKARTIVEVEEADRGTREDIFMGGLFHDLGKLVLAANLAESYAEVIARAGEGTPLTEAERRILGATHAEAGAYLLSLWGFHDDIISACAFHHAPSAGGIEGLTSALVVHVANVLDHELRAGADGSRQQLESGYLEKQGVSGRLEVWRDACAGVDNDTGEEEPSQT